MITKPGRQAYDPSIPREPLDPSKLKKPEFGVVSRQKTINIGPDGTADLEQLNKYKEILTKKGFEQIPPNDIYDVKLGTRVAYLTTDNKWRSGGFLADIKNSNTLHGTKKLLDEYKIYIIYKGFNGAAFTVQLEDIGELWVRNKKKPKISKREQKELKKKKMQEREEKKAAGLAYSDSESESETGHEIKNPVLVKIPVDKTNFPLILEDEHGTKSVIKYFRDEHDRKRFMTTEKYNRIVSNGWIFVD